MAESKKEVTPNERPKTKKRQKPLDVKKFVDTTKKTILNELCPNDQNLIVKELYFAVRENRKMLIEEQAGKLEYLAELNRQIPIDE